MAYEKHTWSCGETVTADLLNRMEEGAEDAQNGYECTEERITVFEGNVTTEEDEGDYIGAFETTSPLDGDSIIVIFNNTEYELPKSRLSRYGEWGSYSPDFTNFPCAVEVINNTLARLWTESAASYSVTVKNVNTVIRTSECFDNAVKELASYYAVEVDSSYVASSGQHIIRPFSEAMEAYGNGKMVIFRPKNNQNNVYPLMNLKSDGLIFAKLYDRENEGLTEILLDIVNVDSDGNVYRHQLSLGNIE